MDSVIKKIKQDIYQNKIAILFVFIYIFCMQLIFKEVCPVKALFHINCPGCGLTHAALYILKGQFINAFNANYTIFAWLPLIVLIAIDRYIHKFNKNIVLLFFILVCFITILRYVLIYIIKIYF